MFFSAVFADIQPTFMNKHVAQTPSPSTELFILKRDLEQGSIKDEFKL